MNGEVDFTATQFHVIRLRCFMAKKPMQKSQSFSVVPKAGESASHVEKGLGAQKPIETPHVGGKGGGVPSGAGDVFSFTLVDGQVTDASMTLPNGSKVSLPLNTGVLYSVSGSDVLATLTNAQGIQTLRYSDTDADGLYEVIASSKVMTAAPVVNMLGFSERQKLAVTLDTTDGHVTGVTQTQPNGSSKVLLSDTITTPNTTWAMDQGLLVETVTNAAGQAHWEVFRDGNLDGVYTEVADGTGALIDLVGVVAATEAVVGTL